MPYLPRSLTYNSTIKDVYICQEYVSWNINWHKPGKSTTGMMLPSLLRVQDNNILPKWYEETIGLYFDCSENGDLHHHLNPSATISIYGWRYQARQYRTYANGLPCLFRLKVPPFTLQLKLLHPCVSFFEKTYKNVLQQVLWELWSIYYLYFSKFFGKYWFRNYVYLISSKKHNETKCFSKSDRFI